MYKYAESVFGKLKNEIKTYTIYLNLAKTISDNVYLMVLYVLFETELK